MVSKKSLYTSALTVGRMHGTAFYFNKEASSSFLDHIERRYSQDIFNVYFNGFLEGIDGKHKLRYRFMDAPRIVSGVEECVESEISTPTLVSVNLPRFRDQVNMQKGGVTTQNNAEKVINNV